MTLSFSQVTNSHITDLTRKLRVAGFTPKCLLCQSSITHLGFQYSAQGISPSTDKTKVIAEWPTPANPKELRPFLGLANFYRNFVPGFANISAPLNDLTSNKTPFTWTPCYQTTFHTLRQCLMSPPILDYTKWTDHFTLITDAADVGLGGVLSASRHTVIEFASWALTATEKSTPHQRKSAWLLCGPHVSFAIILLALASPWRWTTNPWSG